MLEINTKMINSRITFILFVTTQSADEVDLILRFQVYLDDFYQLVWRSE